MTRNNCSRRLVISANRKLMDHYFHPLKLTFAFWMRLRSVLLLGYSRSPSERMVYNLQQLYKVLSKSYFCPEFQIEYHKNLCLTDSDIFVIVKMQQLIFPNRPRVLQSHKRPTTYVPRMMQRSTTLQTSVMRPYNINTLSSKKGR